MIVVCTLTKDLRAATIKKSNRLLSPVAQKSALRAPRCGRHRRRDVKSCGAVELNAACIVESAGVVVGILSAPIEARIAGAIFGVLAERHQAVLSAVAEGLELVVGFRLELAAQIAQTSFAANQLSEAKKSP